MLYAFLRDTLRFFGHHWVPLVAITAGLGLVFELLLLISMPVLAGFAFPWPAYLLQWAGGVWAMAAVILYLDRALAGEYLAPVQALRLGLAWVLPLAGLQLLTGLVVGFGLLLIVPGLYFGVRLALASFYLLLDREPILDAMKAAWRGSVGYGWTLFGGYALIYGGLMLAIQFAVATLVPASEGYNLVGALVGVALKPVAALALVFGFRVYSDSQQGPSGG